MTSGVKMLRRMCRGSLTVVGVCLTFMCGGRPADAQGLSQADQATYFVENQGQWDAPFAFKMNGGNAIWYVTSTGMTIDFRQYERQSRIRSRNPIDDFMDRHEPEPVSVRGHVLKMNFANANPSPLIFGEDQLSHYSNYFLGQDSCKWRGHVSHYQRVVMQDVWPGIDVELVTQPEGVETVYHVAPNADPCQIRIEYEGLDAPLSVDANCSLLLQTSLGIVKEKAPWAYQQDRRVQITVDTYYSLLSASAYSLSVRAYDRQKEMTIDPLLYSTFFGGDGSESIDAFTIDNANEKIIAGTTFSSDFPITQGAYQETPPNGRPMYVTKFNTAGTALAFSTYLGGDGLDYPFKLLCDPDNNIYVAGNTEGSEWPLTLDAFDTTYEGNYEAFLARLSTDGAELQFSSYLGGMSYDIIRDLAWDEEGTLYLCGETASSDFLVTADAMFPEFQPFGQAFVAMFAPSTSALFYSTFFGGGGQSITGDNLWLNGLGNLWLSGGCRNTPDLPVTEDAFQDTAGSPTQYDGYFAHLDFTNNVVLYCSYLGGSGSEGITAIAGVRADTIVVAGSSRSSNFPVTSEAYDTSMSGDDTGDAFVFKLHLPTDLLSSTYFGGSSGEYLRDAVWESDGSIIISGWTYSPDFPMSVGGWDTTFNDDPIGFHPGDIYLSRLSNDLTALSYSTYIGGNYHDEGANIIYQTRDSVWIAGTTESVNFPTTPDAYQVDDPPWTNGFLLRFDLTPPNTATDPPVIASDYAFSVFPNPFNPDVTVSFSLAAPTRTSLVLYDVLGRELKRNRYPLLDAGSHRIAMNLQEYPSGTYFIQLVTPTKLVTQKCLKLK